MLLGLDLGTSSIKALLTESNGRIVASASSPVKLRQVESGGAEQDMEDIRSAIVSAIGQLAGRVQQDLSVVRAIGVSSQGGALQVLSSQYQPIGPVISWLDGRGGPWDQRLTAELGGPWFAGHCGYARSMMAVGQILRLREQSPQLLSGSNRIGFVGDAIVHWLCGRGAHDATSLSICDLYNPALGTADPDLLRRIGVDEAHLPDLIDPREAAGRLTPAAAARTRLPEGVPVSAAVHDQYAAALGCGAIRPGDVMFGAGTAWVLVAVVDRFLGPAIEPAIVCRHVVDGLYGQLLSMVNGGSSFSWAKNLLGLGQAGADVIEAMIASVAPGSDGVRYWPLLAAGGGYGLPGDLAGRLDGLRLWHGPGHILRAVVEGLAMELARHLRMLDEGGVEARRLIMCGGAAASEVTPQIVADATGLEVACTPHGDISALGAAIIARGLVEPRASLADLSDQMAPSKRIVSPGPHRGLYQQLVEEYVSCLPRMEDTNSRAAK